MEIKLNKEGILDDAQKALESIKQTYLEKLKQLEEDTRKQAREAIVGSLKSGVCYV
ncbi:hypothetical protein RGQ13_08655 [Thalassotalea psychrophila]|uniref:Uncharacterized protein n=1 Tax=Thalassotalea psychrophila TaxID=3065647 RepID=A0ABY9TZP7_9GAMM|nr:hypothetical protein RGQ13_08655 [Colwelliaceae bacterium SQ149]